MSFNWLDYCFIGLIGYSTLISLNRGLVKEAFSLINWVAATWLAFGGYRPVADWLPDMIHSHTLRLLVAFVIIVVLVILAGTLLGWLLGQLVSQTGLGAVDRALGLIFGGLRGILIVTLMIILARLTPLPEENWWHASKLLPYFHPIEVWLYTILPAPVMDYIDNL